MARSGQFWRKHEAVVMRSLGFNPTPNSGAGEWHKEDGQTSMLIVQLKSTEAKSIGVARADIKTLLASAARAHKLPIFVIDYLGRGDFEGQLLCIRPQDLQKVAEAMAQGGERIDDPEDDDR